MKHTKISPHTIRSALVACAAVLAALLIAQGRPAAHAAGALSMPAIAQAIVTGNDASVPDATVSLRGRSAEAAAPVATF
ncbi:MAG: hypothetical protein ABI781_02130 [Burkholderiales bacterium]